LMEGGLPAVVANQYSVLDPSAVAFAQYLYWAIAQGASIGEAAREARIAVNYSITGDLIDWAVPVVYARDPHYRLCRPAARVTPLSSAPPSSIAIASAFARGEGADRKHVGIADIASYFPELPAILDRFNQVQEQFFFREVKVVVPLGVWDRVDGKRHLNANRFVERIRDKVTALGVDYLACVTNSWLRVGGSPNPYLTAAGRGTPIVAISTAGALFPAQGPDAARAVANGLVSTLAAHLLSDKTKGNPFHERGPRRCPFHVRPANEPLTQRMRFDDTCRRKLLGAVDKGLLDAFDALLAAYDA
jgi:hypothetical protein